MTVAAVSFFYIVFVVAFSVAGKAFNESFTC